MEVIDGQPETVLTTLNREYFELVGGGSSGGGAKLVGLADALQKNFDKPTEVWDPTLVFGVNIPGVGEEVFREKASQMTVAIGLAARMGRN